MADEKKAPAKNKKPNIFARFFKYLKEVKSVIVIVVISAVFIGVIDLVFKNIVSFSVGQGIANLFS